MLKISRAILATFLPNPQAISQFEMLQDTTVSNEDNIVEAFERADRAQGSADAAQVSADQAQLAADAAQATANSALLVTNAIQTDEGAKIVGFAPGGGVAASNLQEAVLELDSEKASYAKLLTTVGATLIGVEAVGNVAGPTVQEALISLDSKANTGIRNLVLNGSFAINQRRYVSNTPTTAAGQYTLDMWRVVTSGQRVSFAAGPGGNVVVAPDGGLEQVIEGASISQTQHVVSWSGTASCSINGIAVAQGAMVELTPGTNSVIRFSGGTISKVGLEPGTVAHPFEVRPMSLELWLCQRYCFAWSSAGSVGVCNGGGGDLGVVFPNSMRAAPVYTPVTSPTFVDGSAAYATSALQLINSDSRGARLFFNAAGTTAGRAAVFNNDGFGIFSADL